MTPAQLDHLRRIDAHLANLLAIAEKRTPGEWESRTGGGRGIVEHFVMREQDDVAICADCLDPETSRPSVDNAAFIASCAGNAEAGWKATRAAIACLLVICDPASGADFTNYGGETFLPQILAAFPNI